MAVSWYSALVVLGTFAQIFLFLVAAVKLCNSFSVRVKMFICTHTHTHMHTLTRATCDVTISCSLNMHRL